MSYEICQLCGVTAMDLYLDLGSDPITDEPCLCRKCCGERMLEGMPVFRGRQEPPAPPRAMAQRQMRDK